VFEGTQRKQIQKGRTLSLGGEKASPRKWAVLSWWRWRVAEVVFKDQGGDFGETPSCIRNYYRKTIVEWPLEHRGRRRI